MKKDIFEILDDQDLRSQYRKRVETAQCASKDYTGTEKECEAFMRALVEIRRWLGDVFGLEKEILFPTELEERIERNWCKKRRTKIVDLLDRGNERLNHHISEALRSGSSESGLFVMELDGESNLCLENRAENESLNKRIKELILALGEKWIHTDDVIVVRRTLENENGERRPVALVEIPKLDREIVIGVDAEGASFVIRGIQDRKTLLSENGREVLERIGPKAIKIEALEADAWIREAVDLLIRDINPAECKKVEVRALEPLVKEIKKMIPTPEEWAGMKQRGEKGKNNFKVGKISLSVVARKFGIKGEPAENHSVHLALGKKIYGEGHRCLETKEKVDLTPEQLKMEILKRVKSPRQWARMGGRERKGFKIGEMGLEAIASKFGLRGKPLSDYDFHLEIGEKIFGDGHTCLKGLNFLREKVMSLVPTPESWATMEKEEKKAIWVEGMGLEALARRFRIKGNPVGTHSVHLRLGKKIFGEGHEALKEWGRDDLIRAIVERIPMPEGWANMGRHEKKSFAVAGLCLEAIARKFGIGGSPIDQCKVHFELGEKIYGEGTECLKCLDRGDLREKIVEQMPDPETWAKLSWGKRRKFKIGKMGLDAIARKFGIQEDPTMNSEVYFELGRRIYGLEHECLNPKEISLEELRAAIMGKTPSLEGWSKMTHRMKCAYKIGGMGLRKIATRFGIEGNPIHSAKVNVELGELIYGKSHWNGTVETNAIMASTNDHDPQLTTGRPDAPQDLGGFLRSGGIGR